MLEMLVLVGGIAVAPTQPPVVVPRCDWFCQQEEMEDGERIERPAPPPPPPPMPMPCQGHPCRD